MITLVADVREAFFGANDVALDSGGNVSIADMANDWVQRIGASGTITTAAGLPREFP